MFAGHKTINTATNQELNEMYFYETRVMGQIPTAGADYAEQAITKTTIEVFVSGNKPAITFAADHAIPGAIEIKILQPVNPQDFAALCAHFTHSHLVSEGNDAASDYESEYKPHCMVDVSENGLKVFAEDLIEVSEN